MAVETHTDGNLVFEKDGNFSQYFKENYSALSCSVLSNLLS